MFSIEGLKRRWLLELDFLPWAQEVRGSNPRAPTNPFNELDTVRLKNQDLAQRRRCA